MLLLFENPKQYQVMYNFAWDGKTTTGFWYLNDIFMLHEILAPVHFLPRKNKNQKNGGKLKVSK